MVFRIFRRFFWGKNNAAPRPNVVKIVNFTLLFLEAIYLLSMRSDRPELARRSTSEKTAYSWFTDGVLDPLNMTFWGFFNPFSHRKNRKIAFFGAPPKYGKSWQKLAKVGKIWQKLTTVFQADFPKIGPVFSKFGRFSQNRPFFKRVHPFSFFPDFSPSRRARPKAGPRFFYLKKSAQARQGGDFGGSQNPFFPP